MPQKEKNPFVFSWSIKHTRLSFQMFVSSLLVIGVAKYGLAKIQLFGVAELKSVPTQSEAFWLVFFFAIFSLGGFIARTAYEAPSLDKSIKVVTSMYWRTALNMKKIQNKFSDIVEGRVMTEWHWGQQATSYIGDTENNSMLKPGVTQIYSLFKEWSRLCLGNSLIGLSYENLPDRYTNFGCLDRGEISPHVRMITDKIELVDQSNRRQYWQGEQTAVVGFNVTVENLNRTDFIPLQKFARRQKLRAFKLLFGLLFGRFLRFCDIYLLAVIIPIFVSFSLIFVAAIEFGLF